MDLTWVLFCISGSVLKCVLIVSMRDLCLDWVDWSDLGIGLHVWKCCKGYIKLWQHLFIIPRWPCVVVRMFKSNSQLPCLHRIADMPTPKDRMIQTVRWYLSAFHAGRPSEVAKKPYNPILGEHFLCYWTIPTAPECDVSGSGKDILHQDSATLFLSLFFSPALSSPLHPPPTPPSPLLHPAVDIVSFLHLFPCIVVAVACDMSGSSKHILCQDEESISVWDGF